MDLRYPIREEHGKVTKVLSSISILGLFAVAGIIVLLITGTLGPASDNRLLILSLAIVGFICLGSILVTPWVRYLEQGKHKTLAWIFTAFVIVCVILWIVGSFIVNGLIDKINAETITEGYAVGTIKFVRITLIITLQFIAANFIASNMLRYGTRMIPFQIVAYISYAYVDYWLSMLLSAISLPKVDGKYDIQLNTWVTDIIFKRISWTLLILAFVWIIVANTIISSIQKNNDTQQNENSQVWRTQMMKKKTTKKAARKPAAKKSTKKVVRKPVKKVAKKKAAKKPAAKKKVVAKRKGKRK